MRFYGWTVMRLLFLSFYSRNSQYSQNSRNRYYSLIASISAILSIPAISFYLLEELHILTVYIGEEEIGEA